MQLPKAFSTRMERQLGAEASAFFRAYQEPPLRGLRLNPLKYTKAQLAASLPFPLKPAPYSPWTFYAPADWKAGQEPLHHAGAFYMQEPSAAAAVTALRPQPGERVLDLCAAPGGKSTQIAAALAGEGLLWSNEVVHSRATVLLSNIERLGVRNAVVSSCRPEVLCQALAGFFDRVLVDAPCSGEGMFRRDEQAVREWSPAHVESCAVRQQAILESACVALRPGGVLAYSTCTFSEAENEGVVTAFLQRHSDFTLVDCGLQAGHPALGGLARRIYPMDGGEGHFVAILRRAGETTACLAASDAPPSQEAAQLRDALYTSPISGVPARVGDKLYLLPEGLPALSGLGVLRAGVLLGTVKQSRGRGGRAGAVRYEPAHAAFLAAKPKQLRQCLCLDHGDPRVHAFLRGEELEAPESLRGFCAVAVAGAVMGFGKCSGGRLKNHYPKGLRVTW